MTDLALVKRLQASSNRFLNGKSMLSDIETLDDCADAIEAMHAALEQIERRAKDMGGQTPAQRCAKIADIARAAPGKVQP